MPFLNEGLEERQDKDRFMKNMYKFKGVKSERLGQESGGFLEFTKKDVKKIENSGPKISSFAGQNGKGHKKGFGKKHGKGKKGGNKGKGNRRH